jgi:hypothetical protein
MSSTTHRLSIPEDERLLLAHLERQILWLAQRAQALSPETGLRPEALLVALTIARFAPSQ